MQIDCFQNKESIVFIFWSVMWHFLCLDIPFSLIEQAYIEKVENETFYDLEQKLMEVKDRLSFLVSLRRTTYNGIFW